MSSFRKLEAKIASLEQKFKTQDPGCPSCKAFVLISGQRRERREVMSVTLDDMETLPNFHIATLDELEVLVEAFDRAEAIEVERACSECGRTWTEEQYQLQPEDVDPVAAIYEKLYDRNEERLRDNERE